MDKELNDVIGLGLQVRLITVIMSSGDEKLFVVEEFIEGSYKKHNNNAGYVDQVCPSHVSSMADFAG